VRGIVLPAPFPQHSSADCLVSREAAKPRSETQRVGGQWASRGRESAGVALQCFWCCGVLGRVFPLTPDPSPPFHGGEGRISGQLSVMRRAADGSPRVSISVARAFQPEICPLRLLRGPWSVGRGPSCSCSCSFSYSCLCQCLCSIFSPFLASWFLFSVAVFL